MVCVCSQEYIEADDSANRMGDRSKDEVLRRKGHLAMFISTKRQDLTWNRCEPSTPHVQWVIRIRMKTRSKHGSWFLRVDEMYEPRHADSACIHVVHILQHPTSHPTTRLTQDTMDDAVIENFSTLPMGQYGKSTYQSTHWLHQVNQGKREWDADRVWGVGSIAQLMIWNEAFCGEKTANTHVRK